MRTKTKTKRLSMNKVITPKTKPSLIIILVPAINIIGDRKYMPLNIIF